VKTMPVGALRLQLVGELAEVARSAPAEVETLFGLKPWQRLPERPRSGQRRQAIETADLKQHILQRLLAYPELAGEFSEAIETAFCDGEAPIDGQIVEVWRTARAAGGLTSGALQELLADSDSAAQYREAAARELLAEAEPATAREELAGALAKLELRRLNREIELLAAQPRPDAETMARISQLSARRARLMAGSAGEAV
jgi:hypothetical protein